MMITKKGSLKQISAIKLILSAVEQDFNGVLYLKKEEALKILYFNQGKLLGAISNLEKDKLEKLLVKKGLVDLFTVEEINQEESIAESMGKILVEKGLVTLEKLIEITKEQFEIIVRSVLKWEDGSFQFVDDSPPTRPLSLDINILNFVFNYIIHDLDINYITGEIGSLEVKLVKNPKVEKINKYNLNEKQNLLLNRFNGLTNLEGILSTYSEENRNSVLKIIYFFLVTELLIRKDVELDVKQKFDGVKPGIRNSFTSPERPDGYVYRREKIDIQEEKKKPEKFFAIPRKPAPRGKKKSKHFNFVLILIIFILIIGGVIFLVLMPDEKIPGEEKKADREKIVDVAEKIPKVKTEEKKATEIQMKKIENGEVKKKKETKADLPQEKPALKVKKAQDEIKETPEKKEAFFYFKEGKFKMAADQWRKIIIDKKIEYSILLELDCVKESVLNAYSRIEKKDDFFILNRRMGNRICFLVLWGRFKTQSDADEAIKLVPRYFWDQSNPPQVIKLSKYL